MMLLLKGGPYDGRVIDTSKVCNGNDEYCPAHGFRFTHPELLSCGETGVMRYETHKYDLTTGWFKESHAYTDLPGDHHPSISEYSDPESTSSYF